MSTIDEREREAAARSIAPVVRLVCEVRLVVLLVAVVSSGHEPWQFAVALPAAFCSYLPARHWARRGGRLSRSELYLAVDTMVASAVVLVFAGSETAFLYAGATVALLGIVAGRTIALIAAGLVGGSVVLSAYSGSQAPDVAIAVVAGLGAASLAVAGHALGDALRAQARAAELLAAERERRTADLERLAVARDVHDSVAGGLAGLVLMATALARKVEREGSSPDVVELAKQVDEASRIAHADTRAVLGQLRQLDPDPVATLGQVCRRWSFVTGTEVQLETTGDGAIDGAVGEDLKAMLTELLENVRKHARATSVHVHLAVDVTGVTLVVADDGVGMPDDVPGASTGHYGLCGLEERARAHGGRVSVASRDGRTEIKVELLSSTRDKVET